MELHESLVPLKPYVDYLIERMLGVNLFYVQKAVGEYNKVAEKKRLPAVNNDEMASALVQGAFLLVGSIHNLSLMEAACGVLFGVDRCGSQEWWSVNTQFKKLSDKMKGARYNKVCAFF